MTGTKNWILVSGSPASGIGKGCAAAVLARGLARAGWNLDYRKVEPCLQGDIASMPNTEFGEILVSKPGVALDGDTARASFYIPGFNAQENSDVSMGRLSARFLLRLHSSQASAPRLIESLSAEFSDWPATQCRFIELGGTSGEPENLIVVRSLIHAFGKPRLHVHVTSLVRLPCGRITSKPSQLGIESSGHHPDLILVRGGDSAALRASVGASLVIPVSEDHWPERAWQTALWKDSASLFAELRWPSPQPDPLFQNETAGNATLPVRVVTDRAGLEGYGSLVRRLLAWSNGRIRIIAPEDRELPVGIVRIGEAEVPAVTGSLVLEIVPGERNYAPRDPAARPDWLGTADHPEGAVWNFVCDVIRTRRDNVSLPYSTPSFADRYLLASRGGKLRDHGLLDPLVDRALPAAYQIHKIRVLDVGCGDGRWSAKLVANGARVVGVEPAAPMAHAARQRNLLNFELIESPIEAATLPGRFDAAIALCSLDHVVDLPAALSNIAGSLVPLGRLIITTEHPLRTAPLTGPRWCSDGAGRIRDYGEEGFRYFQWFDRPEPVPVFHRTFGSWVEKFSTAGLRLLAVCEPLFDGEKEAGNPRFWLLLAEKCGIPKPIVTIDGPAGSGKTTLAAALSKELNWGYLDTGMMIRAFAVRHLRDPGRRTRIDLAESGTWLLNGKALSSELGEEAVIAACREVANHPDDVLEMEEFILAASRAPAVLVGRALGRTLRPAARFWLETSISTRSDRRGVTPDSLERRDAEDRGLGRLLPPDLTAVTLDGERSVTELVAQVKGTCIAVIAGQHSSTHQ